jgi:hypothetical protein
MSAFDALTKIKQAVEHPKTDHQLPKSRLLAFKAIISKTALQGTKGDHVEVVHGDHSRRVLGDFIENVSGNHSATIKKDQTIRIEGDHRETLVGQCYQNIIGPHMVTNMDVRNETRLDTYTKVYGEFEVLEDDNGKFHRLARTYTAVAEFDFEYYTAKLEIDAVLAQLYVIGALTLGTTQATISVFQNSWDGVHLSQRFLLQEIKNIASDIAAWASHAGLGEGDFRCIMNACPDIGTGTPFR